MTQVSPDFEHQLLGLFGLGLGNFGARFQREISYHNRVWQWTVCKTCLAAEISGLTQGQAVIMNGSERSQVLIPNVI